MLAVGAGLSQASADDAPAPRRAVSINLCTDQLVLALAEREQIAGLSRIARSELSYLAGQAVGVSSVDGGAEGVLVLKPDLVLAGAFSGAETRAVLVRQGIRVEAFAPVMTIAGAREEAIRVANLLGRADRGAALVAEIDRAIAQARGVGKGLTAIAYERRGFAAGRGTLLDELMVHMGLENAATRAGIRSVGAMPLEVVVQTRPDVLILDWGGGLPPDQGTALLQHPALARAVPSDRHIVLPANLVACAGPALPAAIDRLAAEVRRIKAGGR